MTEGLAAAWPLQEPGYGGPDKTRGYAKLYVWLVCVEAILQL